MTEEQIENLYVKLNDGEKLIGQEALYFLALQFSNATHGNYSPEALLHRVALDYSIQIQKETDYAYYD